MTKSNINLATLCRTGAWGTVTLKMCKLQKAKTITDEDGSSMYFVFKLSHMGPAFSVLEFRYVCSTIVFIAECLHKRSVNDYRLKPEHIRLETPQLPHSYTVALYHDSTSVRAVRNINNWKSFISHRYGSTAI